MSPEEGPHSFFLDRGGVFIACLAALVAIGLLVHALLLRRLSEERLARSTRRIEGTLFCLFLAVMIVLSGLQVVLRNFFHSGLLWCDPLVRTLVLWVAFLGALTATSHHRHLHIDVLHRMLPGRWSIPVGRVLSSLSAICCGLLAHGAYIYLRGEQEQGRSPFLGIPSWAAQSILLWGFALLSYRFLIQAIWPSGKREEVLAVRE